MGVGTAGPYRGLQQVSILAPGEWHLLRNWIYRGGVTAVALVFVPCPRESLESLLGSYSWRLGQGCNLKAPSDLTGKCGGQNVMEMDVATATLKKTMISSKSQRMGCRLSICAEDWGEGFLTFCIPR